MDEMNLIHCFLSFREGLKSEVRGGVLMYDVEGCHKYLREDELFDYFLKSQKGNS